MHLEIKTNKTFDKEEFEEVFSDNIKIHLRADVPIAFTLSGGFDSSSIVKKSLEFKQQNNKAYSFISNNKNENDEKKFIKQFLRENSLNHSFVSSNKKFEKDLLEELI